MRNAGVATLSLQEERFEELFNTSYTDVRAFALRRVADRGCADDVVAETFIVAWRRIDQVPDDPGEALLWLYRVAMYGVLNAARGDRRRAALRDRLRREAPNESRLGAYVVALDDGAGVLAAAFSTLTEPDRAILLLAAWEGLDPAQLAVVLGCSAGAAATRLSRARARFEQATLDEGER